LLAVAMHTASGIVTVSHSARRDLLRLHGIDADRVSVVHEAAAPRFQPISDCARLDEARRRYGLPARFVLYVGTIEPRKNLPRLMQAFAAARAQGMPHELVCAGPYGWSSRDLTGVVQRLGIRRVVHFTGYVAAEDLPALYNLGEMFAFPSVYEGFGLPVVEAMACGTPVITSNTSSLDEIAAGAAETVDPYDVDALTAALGRLARDAAWRKELSERGLARARRFSWTRTARQMLAVYQRAAGLTVASVAPVSPALDPIPAETGSLAAMRRETSS
jgi:glycosyltransferase involved in cell wall biosynthesis